MGKNLVIMFSLFTSLIFSQDSLTFNNFSKIQRSELTKGILIGSTIYAGGMLCLNYQSYHDDEPVPFHFINDFKSFLQVDKFQHGFSSYLTSSLVYNWLRRVGVNKKYALFYGGTLGIVLPTTKEFIDAFNRTSGFSWIDITADVAGSTLYISQEILFDEQILKNKISFSRSRYAEQANGYLGNTQLQSFFKDHNGHTYWLSMNVNKLIFKTELPDWLNVAVGYSANGMFGPFENIKSYNSVVIPETVRYRQYLLSLDIDWPKIKTNSKFISYILKVMNFIKVPFPAIEINSKDHLKGYWIYF